MKQHIHALGRGALATIVAVSTPVLAQDGHIDPDPDFDKHDLTIVRHVSTSFSLATAVNGTNVKSLELQKCDSRVSADQDVAAAVDINIVGSLGTFGVVGDSLDMINTPAELSAVLANNSGWIKVVTSISECGGPASGIVGCADTPGSSFTIINSMGTANTGETIVHEFGHNVGLNHRETPGNPFMKATNFGGNEVNLAETAAYHSGGTRIGPNRPTRFGFVIDDTGSMSEEIAGVRNSLTSHLATFSSGDCESFQLTTFKDNVTTRQPTTDLATIRSQVTGLFASGGGDCPEASGNALSAAGALVEDGGRIFLATDAASRPGTDTTAIASNLRTRGVRVDIILSGNCSSAVGGSVSGDAIRIFSEVAALTGGLFAYVPEVNSSLTGRERFENVAFNIVQGGRSESLVFASPRSVPSGTVVSVEIQGSSTSFVPGTTVSFGSPDVTVLNTTVLSPTRLLVDLDVDAAASGFYDAVASIPLGGGETLDVMGLGLVEATGVSSFPQIVSVQPATLAQGDFATLSIRGAATGFDDGSVVDLGSNITILSATAVSSTEIVVDVEVDEFALVGFRNAAVSTGSEFATDGALGSLFIENAVEGSAGTLLSIAPSSAPPDSTVVATILGDGTDFSGTSPAVSFSGSGLDVTAVNVVSATELLVTIEVADVAPPGVQDLRVEVGGSILTLLDAFTVNALLPDFLADSPCGATLSGGIGATTTFQISAITNSPAPGAEVTLTVESAPAGMSFDPPLPLTGASVSTTATWVPTSSDVGLNSISLRAIDDQGQAACIVQVDVEDSLGFPVCAGELNSTGVAANLEAVGSASIGVNDFAFRMSNMPPDAPGLLLRSTATGSLPLGNGTLCLSPFEPGLVRMVPTRFADSFGNAGFRFPLDGELPGGGSVLAGEILYFQMLFRDTGSEVNLTNALGVLFLP